MVMKIEDNRASNLPIDVTNSIKKLEVIIKIVEDNLLMSKEDILREIVIHTGDLQSSRKIFSLYYPLEGVSLSSYITNRKKTEAMKAIQNIKNPQQAESKIKEITGWNRQYFNRVIKENDIITEVFDVKKIISNISSVYDNLYKLDKMGIVKSECKRTKVIIKDIDWNAGLRMIFSMREYISTDEENNMEKLISYDMFLKNYEWMEDYIKTTKEYNPLFVMDYYTKAQEKLDTEKQDKMMDFVLYYRESVQFNMGELTYYCVNREKFRAVIDEFILPEDLSQYRTIIYKTKLALRIMGKKDNQIEEYIEKFKTIIEKDLQREVFDLFIKNEEGNMKDKLEKIYQLLHNKSKEDINSSIKNLILKGFISLKPSNI